MWYIEGLKKVGAAKILNAPGPVWKLVGVPDLNADGRPDLVWQSQTTGAVIYWTINGVNLISRGYLATGVPVAWQIVGIH